MRMKRIACSRMWSDVNIRVPLQQISNCCKRLPYNTPESVLEEYGSTVFAERPHLIQDRIQVLETNKLDDKCQACINTWPNSPWKSFNRWRDQEWSSDQIKILPYEDRVQRVELMLSNTCNMTCMYCSSEFSSSWQKLNADNAIHVSDSWLDLMLEALYVFVSTRKNNNIVFSFLGGEPLLEPKMFPVLDMLLDAIKVSGTTGHRIQIISNLNLKPKVINNFLSKVKQAPDIFWEINASIDAVGYPGTVIRDGLDWSLFEHNVESILACQEVKYVDFLSTMTCLNVPYYKEMLEWIFDQAKRHRGLDNFSKSWYTTCWPVTDPEQLFPGMLPAKYKSSILDCISFAKTANIPNAKELKHDLENLHNMIGTCRSLDHIESARKWFEQQSTIKGKNYFEIFPHLTDILTEGK